MNSLFYGRLLKTIKLYITSVNLNSMEHANDLQKSTQTTPWMEGQKDRWTYKIDWTPLGTFGPQFVR